MNEIHEHEPVFEAIKASADKVASSAKPGKDRDRIEARMKLIQAQWDKLQKNATDRQTVLNDIEPPAEDYDNNMCEIVPWLTATEKKLKSLKTIPCNKEGLEMYGDSLSKIEKEVEEHEPVRQTVNDLATRIIEIQPFDLESVRSKAQNVNERMDTLKESINDKKDKHNKIKDLWTTYQQYIVAVEVLVVEGMVLCAYDTPALDLTRLKEELQLIDELLSNITTQAPMLNEVEDIAQKVIGLLDKDSSDIVIIKERVANMFVRFEGVQSALEARKSKLESHLDYLVQFSQCEDDLNNWFVAMAKVIEQLDPISTEPETVRKQLVDVEELLDSVQEKRHVLDKEQIAGVRLMELNKENENVTVEVWSIVVLHLFLWWLCVAVKVKAIVVLLLVFCIFYGSCVNSIKSGFCPGSFRSSTCIFTKLVPSRYCFTIPFADWRETK